MIWNNCQCLILEGDKNGHPSNSQILIIFLNTYLNLKAASKFT